MTSQSEVDRRIRAWLEDAGPASMRHGVVDDALVAASQVRQRRSTLPLVGARPWPRSRTHDAGRMASLVVALVALVVASISLLVSGAARDPGPLRGEDASVAGVVPVASPTGEVRIAEIRGTWVAWQPPGTTFDGRSGPALMHLVVDPTGIHVGASTLRSSDLFANTAAAGDGSRLVLTAGTGAADPPVAVDGSPLEGCQPGDIGHYGVTLETSDEGVRGVGLLVLTAVDDACPLRAGVLGRTWVRSHLGDTGGGTAILPVSTLLLRVTLPEATYVTAGTDSGWDVRSDDGRAGIRAYVDPRVVVDPCQPLQGSTDTATTTDQFVTLLASSTGVRLNERTPVTVGGRPATRLLIGGPAADQCGGSEPVGWQTGTLWPLAPRTELYLVEAAPHLLILEPRSPDPGIRQSILESVEFVEELPSSHP